MQYNSDSANHGESRRRSHRHSPSRSRRRSRSRSDSPQKDDRRKLPVGWRIQGFQNFGHINGCYLRNDAQAEWVYVHHPKLGPLPTPAYWKVGSCESGKLELEKEEVFAFWQEAGRRYIFCPRWGNNTDMWQEIKNRANGLRDPGVAFFSSNKDKWYEWSQERGVFFDTQIDYEEYHDIHALEQAAVAFQADLARKGGNQKFQSSQSIHIPVPVAATPVGLGKAPVPGTPLGFFKPPSQQPTSGRTTACPSTPTGYAGTCGPAAAGAYPSGITTGSAAPSTPTGYPLTPAGTCSKGNMSKEHVLPPGSGECIVVQDDSDDGCDTSWKDWYTWNHNNRGGQY